MMKTTGELLATGKGGEKLLAGTFPDAISTTLDGRGILVIP